MNAKKNIVCLIILAVVALVMSCSEKSVQFSATPAHVASVNAATDSDGKLITGFGALWINGYRNKAMSTFKEYPLGRAYYEVTIGSLSNLGSLDSSARSARIESMQDMFDTIADFDNLDMYGYDAYSVACDCTFAIHEVAESTYVVF